MLERMRKQLDLLAVEGKNADLALFNARIDESVDRLSYKGTFNVILHKIVDTSLNPWDIVCINKDCGATM
jgi:hypothetical protein